MITLPDFDKAFEYENNFYLSCDSKRISKILAHYELFRHTVHLPGHIVECGVFKGASLVRFAMFRQLHGGTFSKRLIGFDTFAGFPEPTHKDDQDPLTRWLVKAGNQSISTEQMTEVLWRNDLNKNVELVAGDICSTVPDYLKKHPELKISLLNLDTDIYEPAVVILRNLWPRVVKGGILLLDDFGVFPGETKAVNEILGNSVKIRKLPYAMTPSYVVKE